MKEFELGLSLSQLSALNSLKLNFQVISSLFLKKNLNIKEFFQKTKE